MCGQDCGLTCEYVNQRQLCGLRHEMALVFGISVEASSLCLFTPDTISRLELYLYTEKDQFLKVKSWAAAKFIHVVIYGCFQWS